MKVSSAEFIKNYGALSDKALQEPVTITKNGRDRLVLISSEEYERMRQSYRRVYLTSELSDDDMELISQQRVPEEYAYLDDLLKDWEPEK